jgi:predicted Zn finger-like uncharacterized protein
MIVSCPSCATRYDLPAAALGGAGRKVKCAKCGHNWVQTQEAAEAAEAVAAAARAAAKASAKLSAKAPAKTPGKASVKAPAKAAIVPADPPGKVKKTKKIKKVAPSPESETLAIPPLESNGLFESFAPTVEHKMRADDEPQDFDFSSFGAVRDRGFGHHEPSSDVAPETDADGGGRGAWLRRQLRGAGRWLGLVGALAAVGGFVLGGRTEIVTLWPPAARLYDALGIPVEPIGAGLQLQNVKSEQRTEDGAVALVVEGQILNVSTIDREVPPVLAVSIGPDHKPVHKWQIPVTQSHLAPGAIATFRSVERDPGVVSEVAVTFDGNGS